MENNEIANNLFQRRTHFIIYTICFIIVAYCSLASLSLIIFGVSARTSGSLGKVSKQRDIKGRLHYVVEYTYTTPSGKVITWDSHENTRSSKMHKRSTNIRFIPALPFINSDAGIIDLWIGLIIRFFLTCFLGVFAIGAFEKRKDPSDTTKYEWILLITFALISLFIFGYEFT